jgi:hypothetical protein
LVLTSWTVDLAAFVGFVWISGEKLIAKPAVRAAALTVDRGRRDDDDGPIRDMQQLVRDAAEQRADTPEPASPDHDLVGLPNARHIGDRLRRRTANQLRLVIDVNQFVVAHQKQGIE